MNETAILGGSNEELIRGLLTSHDNESQLKAIEMGITLRNTESLAAAINKASQAGKGLSWVIVGAAVVSAAVEVIKLICVK